MFIQDAITITITWSIAYCDGSQGSRDSGTPWRCGVNERFTGKFRDGCRGRDRFRSRAEAKAAISSWRQTTTPPIRSTRQSRAASSLWMPRNCGRGPRASKWPTVSVSASHACSPDLSPLLRANHSWEMARLGRRRRHFSGNQRTEKAGSGQYILRAIANFVAHDRSVPRESLRFFEWLSANSRPALGA